MFVNFLVRFMEHDHSGDTDTHPDPSLEEYEISPIREAIYWRAEKHKNSLWTTFQRNYFAAKMVGALGWLIELFTAGIGAALIYIVTQSPDDEVYGVGVPDLAILILIGTLVMVFYEPKLRSRKYYNAGQDHQELCDLFIDFIEIEVPNRAKDVETLETRLVKLNARRHRLNQSTPQLGGVWYYSMKGIQNISNLYTYLMPGKERSSWEQKPLQDRMFREKRMSNHPPENTGNEK